MLGNNLAVIALCGLVAEMVALLMWKLAEAQLNGHKMRESDEKALFGRSFEQLGQERRVEILNRYGIISSEHTHHFGKIRASRRQYLHFWSHGHVDIEKDAVACFNAAAHLVIDTIGQDIKEGKILLNPKLLQYLKREGMLEATEQPPNTR